MNILMQIISITVTVSSFVMLVWRMLPNPGIDLKLRINKGRDSAGCVPTNKECTEVFIYSLLFRIFVIAAGFVIYCVFIANDSKIHMNQIYKMWEEWDATNYIRISKGYASFTQNGDYITLVFLPLYSWILKFFNLIIPNVIVAGLTVSAVCSSTACVFMYKLACMDYKRSTAQKVVILMCIFPFAFFYGAIMSESAFFMTSAMTLYYIRKHNWAAAGIAGMLCALSRSVGVFLIFPATVEFIEEYRLLENLKDIKPKLVLFAKKWVWLLLLPAGTLIYLYINYKITGDALYFLKMEEKYWNQTSQPFFQTVGNLWDIIKGGTSLSTKMGAFAPGLAIVLGMYALMLFGIPRHRSMYSAWLWIYLIVNTTMSWPLSLCRYLTCAAPVYLILGDSCDRNKKLYTALVIGFSIMFGIYLTGYLMSKQIM